MDESPGHASERRTVLPALLLALGAGFVAVLLLSAWYTRHGDPCPEWVLRFAVAVFGAIALAFLVAFAGAGRGEPMPPEPEAWLCQHCLKPYVPGAHFCPRCGAPKTFYSGVPDFERAYVQAWLLGKAAHHPSRLVHVAILGVLAVVQVASLGGMFALMTRAHRGDAWVYWESIGASGLALVHTYIFVGLFAHALRSWRRRRRGEEPRRPEIDYGAPPWFSHDAEWALPEYEIPPEE